jgi:hypothetical protein
VKRDHPDALLPVGLNRAAGRGVLLPVTHTAAAGTTSPGGG